MYKHLLSHTQRPTGNQEISEVEEIDFTQGIAKLAIQYQIISTKTYTQVTLYRLCMLYLYIYELCAYVCM